MSVNNNLQVMTTSAALRFYDRAEPMALVQYMGANIAGCFGWGTGQANAVALICVTKGISVMDFYQTYDLMPGGCPRKRAQAVHAEFLAMGGKINWESLGENGVASAKFTLGDSSINYSYSLEKAKRARLVKAGSAWETHPEDMLRKTLVQKAIGILAPGIMWGSEADESFPAGPALQLGKPAETVTATVTVDASAKPSTLPAKTAQPIIEVLPPPAPAEADSDEQELAAAGLAPAQPTEVLAAPLLDDATWRQLIAAIEGDLPQAEGAIRCKAFADKLNSLPPTGGKKMLPTGKLRSLSPARAASIINAPQMIKNVYKV